jgi:hypothetical protein
MNNNDISGNNDINKMKKNNTLYEMTKKHLLESNIIQ